MDLFAASEGCHLTPKERARRMAEGLYLYCGGVGHLVVDCLNSPYSRSRRPVRAVAAAVSLQTPTEPVLKPKEPAEKAQSNND